MPGRLGTLDILEGTPEQHVHANQRRYLRQQQYLVDCMAAASFDYPVEPSMPGVPTLAQVLSAVGYVATWWSTPELSVAGSAGFGYVAGGDQIPAASHQLMEEMYSSLSSAERANYDKALDQCTDTVLAESDLHQPLNAAADSLRRSFENALDAEMFSSEFDDTRERYASCIASHGFAFTQPGQASQVAEDAVADAGLYSVDPSDAFYPQIRATAEAADRAVAVADAECRTPEFEQIVEGLLPTVDRWLGEHEAEVRQAQLAWDVAD